MEASDNERFSYLDESNNLYMTISEFFALVDKGNRNYYLAGDSNIEPLMSDISAIPFLHGLLDFYEASLWIGSGSTVTPLHMDTAENLICVSLHPSSTLYFFIILSGHSLISAFLGP